MEPDARPEGTSRWGRRRTFLILAVAAVVVVAAIVVGWVFLRPWTIAQVYGLDRFRAGSQITIAGTITGIHSENTSYGARVALTLDDEGSCGGIGNVFGEPNATYRIGDSFQTTLHFQAITINGDSGVSAPELVCPFPGRVDAIGHVMDAVGLVAGIQLAFNGTDAGGWVRYDVVTTNGDAYRADVLPAALRKSPPVQGANPDLPAGTVIDSKARWDTWASLQYIQLAGGFHGVPSLDRMTSLAAGTSENGTMRFVDADGNGQVDDGDHLDVHLAPAATSSSWDTYLMTIGGFDPPDVRYVNSFHYLLNGSSGPFEVPLSQKEDTHVQLRYVGSAAGPPVTSQIDVSRVRMGDAPAIGSVQYSLRTSTGSEAGNLPDLPTSLGGSALLAFADVNGDGRLDAGDTFRVGGQLNRTSGSLTLQVAGRVTGFADWIAGCCQPVGRMPLMSLSFQGSNPWTVTVTASLWNPASVLGGTAQVSLQEDLSPVLTDVPLVNGTVGTFAGGSLSFTDADGDGYLSTGDRFVLQGNPTSQYTLRLSILFATVGLASTP